MQEPEKQSTTRDQAPLLAADKKAAVRGRSQLAKRSTSGASTLKDQSLAHSLPASFRSKAPDTSEQ
eukprot:2219645-Pyramimonas_sp.AAC.1